MALDSTLQTHYINIYHTQKSTLGAKRHAKVHTGSADNHSPNPARWISGFPLNPTKGSLKKTETPVDICGFLRVALATLVDSVGFKQVPFCKE